jgi:hypothetical protein
VKRARAAKPEKPKLEKPRLIVSNEEPAKEEKPKAVSDDGNGTLH